MSARASLSWVEYEVKSTYGYLKDQGLDSGIVRVINSKGQVFAQIDPTASTRDEISRDFGKAILGDNLADQGYAPVQNLLKGEAGVEEDKEPGSGRDDIAAYFPVHDPKFLDSLGWGVVVAVEYHQLVGGLERDRKLYYTVLTICAAIAMSGSVYFAFRLSSNLSGIAAKISRSGSSVDSTSRQLASASQELSSGATEVASSLEETVSSLEELTSMVRANADHAGEAAQLSETSSFTAKEGESEVKKLISSISEIANSSKKIE